jgi:hypothetical protein
VAVLFLTAPIVITGAVHKLTISHRRIVRTALSFQLITAQ